MKESSSAKVLPPAAKLLNLHRRKQQVVVTTSSRPPLKSGRERRRRCPTLPGLGYRVELDTIAAEDFDEEPPISCVRVKSKARTVPQAARVPKRPKPVTLFDGGVDDERAADYLEEARRILESGIFDK